MKKGKLIVFSGPSGVGKHTILSQVINNQELNLAYSVSMTTRKMRSNEENGVHYFFVSEDEFQKAIENNELIEWAEFVNNKYGTPRAYVEQLRNQGKNVILEIEVVGALQVIQSYKDDGLVSIFLLPPSLDELKNRLVNRNTESESIIQERLAKASNEIDVKDHYQYQIINDDPKQAENELIEVIKHAISQ